MTLSEIKQKIDEYFATHTEQEVYDALVRNGAIIPEESPESVTLDGWVAVDTSYNGLPYLHTEKPHLEKLVYDDYWCYDMVWECEGDKYMLDSQLFPDMTPKSEPKKFRITITPIEE